MNLLRRLSLLRLLLLGAVVLGVGVSATAIALAVGSGPEPAPKPLAEALHDALSGPSVQGFSAEVQLTDHLLEGASLAAGQGHELSSDPLLTGGSGRLWVSSDGRVRLELQAEDGDTQVLLDGSTLEVYDAAANTLYRTHLHSHDSGSSEQQGQEQAPSVARIEEAIAHLQRHLVVSGAEPTDVGGRPAYTVRLSPREGGSELGGAELSFDAEHGLPLRAAVYATGDSSPVLELSTSSVSYGAVSESVFQIEPPADVKVEQLRAPSHDDKSSHEGTGSADMTIHGHGPTAIAELRVPHASGKDPLSGSGLPTVRIGSVTATELRTELGTILSFERDGVRYVLAGALAPAGLEALARGL